MRRWEVEVFVDGDTDEIRFYPEGGGDGAPCVNIPLKDAIQWAYTFMRFASRVDPLLMDDEFGDEPVNLPGRFGTLNDIDPDEEAG